MLTASTLGVLTQATRALHNLTSKNVDNKRLAVEAGAPRLLIPLLRTGAPAVREQGSGLLRNLAGGSPENKAALADAGAIISIISLLRAESSPGVQANLAVVLYNLVNGHAIRRN